MQVSTIGVDLAKNVFQVHGVDSVGKVVISRQLRRKQVAFGEEQTSNGSRNARSRSKMMWWTTPAPGIGCAKGNR